jgi:hypothetical protein
MRGWLIVVIVRNASPKEPSVLSVQPIRVMLVEDDERMRSQLAAVVSADPRLMLMAVFDRMRPALAWLLRRGQARWAMELLRLPLNRLGVRELFAEAQRQGLR